MGWGVPSNFKEEKARAPHSKTKKKLKFLPDMSSKGPGGGEPLSSKKFTFYSGGADLAMF